MLRLARQRGQVETIAGCYVVGTTSTDLQSGCSYLLHYEHTGAPHCVALSVANSVVSVVDGRIKYAVPTKAFAAAVLEAPWQKTGR
jgi:hypothetical protein